MPNTKSVGVAFSDPLLESGTKFSAQGANVTAITVPVTAGFASTADAAAAANAINSILAALKACGIMASS